MVVGSRHPWSYSVRHICAFTGGSCTAPRSWNEYRSLSAQLNILPTVLSAELESVLLKHPEVADSGAVGVVIDGLERLLRDTNLDLKNKIKRRLGASKVYSISHILFHVLRCCPDSFLVTQLG